MNARYPALQIHEPPPAKPICVACTRTNHEAEVMIRKGTIFMCDDCITDFGSVLMFGPTHGFEVLLRVRRAS